MRDRVGDLLLHQVLLLCHEGRVAPSCNALEDREVVVLRGWKRTSCHQLCTIGKLPLLHLLPHLFHVALCVLNISLDSLHHDLKLVSLLFLLVLEPLNVLRELCLNVVDLL